MYGLKPVPFKLKPVPFKGGDTQDYFNKLLERFSNSRGVTNVVQGGFFLRKKPLEVSGFALHQLENRYKRRSLRSPQPRRHRRS